MRSASSAEDLDVRLRLAGRRQRGPRQLQVVMAVGEVQVGVLEERGDRQQDVGVIGGVGLELLEHDGEQIVAAAGRAARRSGSGAIAAGFEL